MLGLPCPKLLATLTLKSVSAIPLPPVDVRSVRGPFCSTPFKYFDLLVAVLLTSVNAPNVVAPPPPPPVGVYKTKVAESVSETILVHLYHL